MKHNSPGEFPEDWSGCQNGWCLEFSQLKLKLKWSVQASVNKGGIMRFVEMQKIVILKKEKKTYVCIKCNYVIVRSYNKNRIANLKYKYITTLYVTKYKQWKIS